MFDFATLEGKVVNLGENAAIDQRAAGLVEHRAEYVLVLKKEVSNAASVFGFFLPCYGDQDYNDYKDHHNLHFGGFFLPNLCFFLAYCCDHTLVTA